MNAFVILPDQLFYEERHVLTVANHDNIYICEEPAYFTKWTYHRAKLILHRASMQCYYEYLKNKFEDVEYIKKLTKKPTVHYITCEKILNTKAKAEEIAKGAGNSKDADAKGAGDAKNASATNKADDGKSVDDTNKKGGSKKGVLKKGGEKSGGSEKGGSSEEIKKDDSAKKDDTADDSADAKTTKKLVHNGKCFLDWLKESVERRQINMWYPSSIHAWGDRLKKEKYYGLVINFIDTPAFVHSMADIGQYQPGKSYKQTAFYIAARKKFTPWLCDANGKPIGGKWSFDEDNRHGRADYDADNVKPAAIPALDEGGAYAAAIRYTTRFKTIAGSKPARYPINADEAKQWFEHFLRTNFTTFGKYEDLSISAEKSLFHSVLSSSLNIGILTPAYVIGRAGKYWLENKIPNESGEAFVRQILGWREYMHMMYCVNKDLVGRNFFALKRRLSHAFYTGETGAPVIDEIIEDVLETGYTHHINRLMFLGAFMLINEIHPAHVHRWFMEMFIDAYEWVMAGNIAMSQFNAGNILTNRPYFSSYAYITRMSDADKSYATSWNALYYNFINNHAEQLASMHFVSSWVKNWREKTDKERAKIIADAKKAIV